MIANTKRFSRAIMMLVVIFAFAQCQIQHANGQEDPAALSGFTSDEIFKIQDGEALKIDDKNLGQLL